MRFHLLVREMKKQKKVAVLVECYNFRKRSPVFLFCKYLYLSFFLAETMFTDFNY